MKRIVALILGGGRGTRLYPLTSHRAKPAVPIGGKYRLIDIPLSNCINSEIIKIYVLTQFNSVSLHHHVQSYAFDRFGGGFVEILAAQQTSSSDSGWYQGTADAVRQNFNFIEERDIDHVLILSGDQLYQMDFQKMLATHIQAEADVTIAGIPVATKDASALGIMRLDDTGRVVGFLEKPESQSELNLVRMPTSWIDERGIPSNGRDCIASMGIYLFNKQTLLDALLKTSYKDFGKEVFPAVIRTKRVQLHLFDGYWEDIGTIRSFYEANLAMAREDSPFSISDPDSPIFTQARALAPTRFEGCTVRRSLISDGCQIAEGSIIEDSVIGVRCHIGKNVKIRKSIVMGNDYYLNACEIKEDRKNNRPLFGIGDNSVIEGAIIDKSCRIGKNVVIANPDNIQDTEEKPYGMIRDGIICFQKDITIPDSTKLTF